MKYVVGLIAGACCTAVLACASHSKMSPMTAGDGAVAPQNAGVASTDVRHQIQELSAQLDADRARAGLQEPTATATASAACENPSCSAERLAIPPPSASDQSCHPGTSDTCKDSCTLSDAICDAAKKICDLAQQLPGDGWAAGKCANGTSTCTSAHAKCCGCQL